MRFLSIQQFRRGAILIALVLLAQLPCFCVTAAHVQVAQVSAHSCCPHTQPVAKDHLQANCAHCASVAAVPTNIEVNNTAVSLFAQPLLFVLHTFSLSPELSAFNVSDADYFVPVAHAPPVFISQARFLS